MSHGMVYGRITRAGVLNVNGESLTGFFVETTGPEIVELSKQGLYNERVYVRKERRRMPVRPVSEPVYKTPLAVNPAYRGNG